MVDSEETSAMTDKTPQGDAPEGPRLNLTEASDTSEARPGTLTLTYADGMPTLTISGGNAVPSPIAVVDESGNIVAVYAVGPATRSGTGGMQFAELQGMNINVGKLLGM